MPAEATYCRVLPSFWSDPKVKRKLTPQQKYLLLYFFTSPHTNLVGLYYLPLTYAEAEAGIPLLELEEWVRGPLAPFVSYDWETEEILVHRAARHQIGEELKERDNRTKAVERILRDTHSAELVAKFRSLYPDWHVASPAPAAPPAPCSPALSGEIPTDVEKEGPPSPSVSPSARGLVSHSSSRAVTGTEQNTTTTIHPQAARDPVDEDQVGRIIMLANRGMAENDAIPHYEPIPPGHGSRQFVIDWLLEGVAASTIETVVLERARTYRPDRRHRQINTMRYFDSAVHEEHDRVSASTTEVKHAPNGNGKQRHAGAAAGEVPGASGRQSPREQSPREQSPFGDYD